MIKRALWLGIGIAVGAVVARKVTSAVQAYSPSGLAGTARNSAAGLMGSVRDFVADVREGMVEREDQIHEAFSRGVSLTDVEHRVSGADGERSGVDAADLVDGHRDNGNGAGKRR